MSTQGEDDDVDSNDSQCPHAGRIRCMHHHCSQHTVRMVHRALQKLEIRMMLAPIEGWRLMGCCWHQACAAPASAMEYPALHPSL